MNKIWIVAVIVFILLIIGGIYVLYQGDDNGGEDDDKLTNVVETSAFNDDGIIECRGDIDEDCIVLTYSVSITFPYDEADGALFIEGLWPYTVYGNEQIGLRNIDGELNSWIGVQGEHHYWNLTFTICETLTNIECIIDDEIVFSAQLEFGWDLIEDGSHDIFSYFINIDPITEDYVEDLTDPFSLVKSGNDYWFEQ